MDEHHKLPVRRTSVSEIASRFKGSSTVTLPQEADARAKVLQEQERKARVQAQENNNTNRSNKVLLSPQPITPTKAAGCGPRPQHIINSSTSCALSSLPPSVQKATGTGAVMKAARRFSGTSTVTTYQDMLAKAKADHAEDMEAKAAARSILEEGTSAGETFSQHSLFRPKIPPHFLGWCLSCRGVVRRRSHRYGNAFAQRTPKTTGRCSG
jgi:hypothetical protein